MSESEFPTRLFPHDKKSQSFSNSYDIQAITLDEPHVFGKKGTEFLQKPETTSIYENTSKSFGISDGHKNEKVVVSSWITIIGATKKSTELIEIYIIQKHCVDIINVEHTAGNWLYLELADHNKAQEICNEYQNKPMKIPTAMENLYITVKMGKCNFDQSNTEKDQLDENSNSQISNQSSYSISESFLSHPEHYPIEVLTFHQKLLNMLHNLF